MICCVRVCCLVRVPSCMCACGNGMCACGMVCEHVYGVSEY